MHFIIQDAKDHREVLKERDMKLGWQNENTFLQYFQYISADQKLPTIWAVENYSFLQWMPL